MLIARRVARIALTTEAQPLMPQTHGTRSGASCASRDNARGNGMPMQKASGAISNSERMIFGGSGSGISQRKIGGRRIRWRSAIDAMLATAREIADVGDRRQPRQPPVHPLEGARHKAASPASS